mmetsp:Transcript_9730/g.27118  ORF Transcript_9730/g.27118 Transcript_9730/m.27118 type:complete len:282 (-) Transcript_9730:1247-2092(-)
MRPAKSVTIKQHCTSCTWRPNPAGCIRTAGKDSPKSLEGLPLVSTGIRSRRIHQELVRWAHLTARNVATLAAGPLLQIVEGTKAIQCGQVHLWAWRPDGWQLPHVLETRLPWCPLQSHGAGDAPSIGSHAVREALLHVLRRLFDVQSDRHDVSCSGHALKATKVCTAKDTRPFVEDPCLAVLAASPESAFQHRARRTVQKQRAEAFLGTLTRWKEDQLETFHTSCHERGAAQRLAFTKAASQGGGVLDAPLNPAYHPRVHEVDLSPYQVDHAMIQVPRRHK